MLIPRTGSIWTATFSDMALPRSEEHTSELQSPCKIVCRLLLEKKNVFTSLPPARSTLRTSMSMMGLPSASSDTLPRGSSASCTLRSAAMMAALSSNLPCTSFDARLDLTDVGGVVAHVQLRPQLLHHLAAVLLERAL